MLPKFLQQNHLNEDIEEVKKQKAEIEATRLVMLKLEAVAMVKKYEVLSKTFSPRQQ